MTIPVFDVASTWWCLVTTLIKDHHTLGGGEGEPQKALFGQHYV